MKLLTLLATLSIAALAPAADIPKKAPTKAKPEASPELQATYAKLTPAQKGSITRTINSGDLKAITNLPGIGAVRAAAVIAGRPYDTALDLLRVPGIGEGTLQEIITAAKSAPTDEPAKSEPKKGKKKKKSEPKKEAEEPKKKAEPAAPKA